jgi:hypothetical protein
MEQRSQDFQERARRQELTDRELCGIGLNLGKDDLTTAGDLLYLVLDSERKNFESIALADQILKDRRYLIAKDYFSELAEGTFQTWRDLLYTNEGIFSNVYERINLLAWQVWNYSYFKTNFAVDNFRLDMTLARVFNDPPHLDWDIQCPTHTQGRDLGFAWYIGCTSKQVYAISRLITELCPSFLPQGIEKQYFSDLPLLLQWREFDLSTKNSVKRDSSQRYPTQSFPGTTVCLYIHLPLQSFARLEIY